MCGIIGLFNIQNEEVMRAEALKMVRKIGTVVQTGVAATAMKIAFSCMRGFPL